MSIAVKVNDPTNSGATTSTTGTTTTGTNSASDLQSSFLTLLVAQLKKPVDPTNPLQNNELTTQLAQISTVSGIEN